MLVRNKLEEIPKNYIRIFGNYISETDKSIYFSWDNVVKHLPKSKIIMLVGGIKPIYYIQKWVLNYCK